MIKAVGTAEAGKVSASPLFCEVGVVLFARALIITLLFSLDVKMALMLESKGEL